MALLLHIQDNLNKICHQHESSEVPAGFLSSTIHMFGAQNRPQPIPSTLSQFNNGTVQFTSHLKIYNECNELKKRKI
jgi:hypothetical protein